MDINCKVITGEHYSIEAALQEWLNEVGPINIISTPQSTLPCPEGQKDPAVCVTVIYEAI